MSDEANSQHSIELPETMKVKAWIEKSRLRVATLRVQTKFEEASALSARISEAERTLAEYMAKEVVEQQNKL